MFSFTVSVSFLGGRAYSRPPQKILNSLNLHFQMRIMILELFQYLFFTFGGSHQFPQDFCAELCWTGVRLLLVANTAIVLKQTQFPYSQDTGLTVTNIERSLQCIVCDELHSCSELNCTDLQRQPFSGSLSTISALTLSPGCTQLKGEMLQHLYSHHKWFILLWAANCGYYMSIWDVWCNTYTLEKKSTFNQP